MFVFLEHHRDADSGAVVTTDVIASSNRNGIGIYWKQDKDLMDFLTKLLKTPDFKDRMFDNETKIWTYLGDVGWKLLQKIQETLKNWPMFKIEFIETEHLLEQIQSGGIHLRTKAYDPSTFFYQKEQKYRSVTYTRESAGEKIAEIFGIPLDTFKASDKEALKKLYRASALRLHPDRNNGDGSKMSELNMLWGIFNA